MFKVVFLHFLGNIQAENYKELVEDLLNAYQTMRCDMSLKFFLCVCVCVYSHLGFFPLNLGTVCNEHGERFH